jgi:hypothetical protein
VGLFSKKPTRTVAVCEMCSKTEAEGCGWADHHVEPIGYDEPTWLPEHLRAQAPGEFTWLCVRCNSYPAMKWPGSGGASSGMIMHLGRAHHVGFLAGSNVGIRFSMIPVNQ